VRLRVLGDHAPLYDVDHDLGHDLLGRAGNALFGTPEVRPEDFDRALGELAQRDEVRAARDGSARSGCHEGRPTSLVFCYGARGVELPDGRVVLHATDGSNRALGTLYDLREDLLRIMLITLPFVALFAFLSARRLARPIEALRTQALARVGRRDAVANLAVSDHAEVSDLATAFNTLLGTLDGERRAREASVADLAHEMKNPVAAIQTATEGLKVSASDQRQGRLIQVLHQSSARLDQLVSQFLDVARVEAGALDEARAELDLNSLIDGVVRAARADPRWSGVDFRWEPPGALRIEGASARLESVARNLIENAASFAGDPGWVSVSVSVSGDVEAIELTVADSGPGIAEDELTHVFHRFYTSRGRQRGTGLGLALTRAIVEAHGGAIRVDRAPEAGATFCVRLPRSRS
jgi:two-component system sensor histidine kinase ChvG